MVLGVLDERDELEVVSMPEDWLDIQQELSPLVHTLKLLSILFGVPE